MLLSEDSGRPPKRVGVNFIIRLFQASTCFEHMCSWSRGQTCISQSVHGTATYRCDDTRDCIVQFCPPDDEHVCSKHVEAWNKRIIKFSASSCLIFINKYIEMHGQHNIKKYLDVYFQNDYTEPRSLLEFQEYILPMSKMNL